MGAGKSLPEQPIRPQLIPICATEPRFCLPRNVQLYLKKSFSFTGDFKITDAHNKAIIYFRCVGEAFSLRQKKILIDEAGVPVLNMKKVIFSFTYKFNIFAGDGSERQICKFDMATTFCKAELSTVFCDVLNEGIRWHLVMKKDCRSKRCTIHLGDPKEGGVLLARVFQLFTTRCLLGVEDYIIEIAANVDIAICVIMCIALDEFITERRRRR